MKTIQKIGLGTMMTLLTGIAGYNAYKIATNKEEIPNASTTIAVNVTPNQDYYKAELALNKIYLQNPEMVEKMYSKNL